MSSKIIKHSTGDVARASWATGGAVVTVSSYTQVSNAGRPATPVTAVAGTNGWG